MKFRFWEASVPVLVLILNYGVVNIFCLQYGENNSEINNVRTYIGETQYSTNDNVKYISTYNSNKQQVQARLRNKNVMSPVLGVLTTMAIEATAKRNETSEPKDTEVKLRLDSNDEENIFFSGTVQNPEEKWNNLVRTTSNSGLNPAFGHLEPKVNTPSPTVKWGNRLFNFRRRTTPAPVQRNKITPIVNKWYNESSSVQTPDTRNQSSTNSKPDSVMAPVGVEKSVKPKSTNSWANPFRQTPVQATTTTTVSVTKPVPSASGKRPFPSWQKFKPLSAPSVVIQDKEVSVPRVFDFNFVPPTLAPITVCKNRALPNAPPVLHNSRPKVVRQSSRRAFATRTRDFVRFP